MSKVQLVNEQRELVALAKKLGVRSDWHEPDEQEVTAKVKGTSFDNAFGGHGGAFTPSDGRPWAGEIVVVIHKDRKPVAQVNLATLFSWACGYEDPVATSELLKAVKAFVRNRTTCPTSNGKDLEAWELLRAAIAKAEGRNNGRRSA